MEIIILEMGAYKILREVSSPCYQQSDISILVKYDYRRNCVKL